MRPSQGTLGWNFDHPRFACATLLRSTVKTSCIHPRVMVISTEPRYQQIRGESCCNGTLSLSVRDRHYLLFYQLHCKNHSILLKQEVPIATFAILALNH